MATEYKILTPKLRTEINSSIDSLMDELKTCERNILTGMQYESLSALKKLVESLPDGYLMPFKSK